MPLSEYKISSLRNLSVAINIEFYLDKKNL